MAKPHFHKFTFMGRNRESLGTHFCPKPFTYMLFGLDSLDSREKQKHFTYMLFGLDSQSLSPITHVYSFLSISPLSLLSMVETWSLKTLCVSTPYMSSLAFLHCRSWATSSSKSRSNPPFSGAQIQILGIYIEGFQSPCWKQTENFYI